MFRKSQIEESFIFKFVWNVFINSIISVNLLGMLLFFIFGKGHIYIYLFFAIGVILELVLSLYKNLTIKLFAWFAPVISTICAMFMFVEKKEDYFPILIILGVFSAICMVQNYFLFYENTFLKGFGYIAGVIARILLIASIFVFIQRNYDGELTVNISQLSKVLTFKKSFIYLVVNLLSTTISLLALISLLFYRITRLTHISTELKHISNWSFDDKVIENDLLRNGETHLINVERTLLFGDIRSFTNYCENQSISEVVNLLSNFYDVAEEIVEKYKGFKPEFIADEFITFFKNKDDCISCALSLREKLNKLLVEKGLSIGMGINKGIVLEGIVGGKNSKKYSIFGHSVNVASRLETNAKGGEILTTEAVIKDLKNIEYQEINGITLKGVNDDFKIYNIIGPKSNKTHNPKEIIKNMKKKYFDK